jgi:exonuclease III
MRIATWNLERPKLGGHEKNSARLKQIKTINADLWVLTETSSAIALAGYTSNATPPESGYHALGENYTTILSRWNVRRTLPTWNPLFSVCVEVESPVGLLLVYGTIITYANDRGPNRTSRRWVEHRKAIEAQANDWLQLRRDHPSRAIVVAGDFNQSRDGSGWYADEASVQLLTNALEAATLHCVTSIDFRSVFRIDRGNIDHFCVGGPLKERCRALGTWLGQSNGVRMSDHNGVYVDFDA